MRVMPKFLGVVAAGFLALGMGAGVAGAGQMPTPHPTNPTHGISQMGSNFNETSQKAKSKAETNQKNVNIPLSLFTVGSNDGSVQQWNKAQTDSSAKNRNWTRQNEVQGQQVTTAPNKSSDCGCKQGEEHHRKHHRRDKNDNYDNKGDNNGSPSSYGPQGDHKSQPGDVSQRGSNNNRTKQHASSSAETNQVNVNAPISAFSVGSNDGNVSQGNQAETQSYASNENGTSQNVGQGQATSKSDSSCGPKSDGNDGRNNGDVSQSGRNSNSTDQSASSRAETNQKNINVPIALFSVGSNDGSVHQGNAANTNSGASNSNGTSQFLGQGQLVGGLLG